MCIRDSICTPFIHRASVTPLVDAAKIGVGAENCADKESGAYTGEVSAAMVASTGAKYHCCRSHRNPIHSVPT